MHFIQQRVKSTFKNRKTTTTPCSTTHTTPVYPQHKNSRARTTAPTKQIKGKHTHKKRTHTLRTGRVPQHQSKKSKGKKNTPTPLALASTTNDTTNNTSGGGGGDGTCALRQAPYLLPPEDVIPHAGAAKVDVEVRVRAALAHETVVLDLGDDDDDDVVRVRVRVRVRARIRARVRALRQHARQTNKTKREREQGTLTAVLPVARRVCSMYSTLR